MKIKDKITKNNLLILFFITVLFSFIITNWKYTKNVTNCSYSWKIEQCMNNQDNIRSISNFVCINGSLEEVTLQVVLDEKFKEIDKTIEEYLDKLEKDKSYYFWPDRKEEFTNAINDIEKYLWPGWVFEKEYKKLCDWEILWEAVKCLWNKISNVNAASYLKSNDSQDKCRSLYKLSLINYRDTAYAILKENKFQVMHDNHKKFTQIQRKKFDELIDYMLENRGYLDDISNDVQSTTKHPY